MKLSLPKFFLSSSILIATRPSSFSLATSSEDGDSRIVGGSFVPVGTYPWFTSLIRAIGPKPIENIHGCGASLVSPEFVLTANHCITQPYRNNPAVRVGAYKKPFTWGNNGGQATELFRVKQIFEHPDYNENSDDNDFALLHLDGKSSFTPVKLDDSNISYSYSSGYPNLWTIGHGAVYYEGNGSNRLKHAQVNYVSNADCISKYGYSQEDITDSMMCARDDGEDSCQGDSGGPLYDKANDVLVGVVSWGFECANPNYPGVYARISYQYDWIISTICQYSNDKPTICDNAPFPAPVLSPVSAPTHSTKNPSGSTKNPSDSTKNPSDSTKKPSDSTKNPSLNTSLSTGNRKLVKKSVLKNSTIRITGGARRRVMRGTRT